MSNGGLFDPKYHWKTSSMFWSWKNIKGSIRRILQNIFWGWNESDTWELDYSFAKFMLPRLRRLKEVNDGVPGIFLNENCNLPISSLNDGNIDEEMKAWNETLDKMILAFDLILNGDNIQDYNFKGEWIEIENEELKKKNLTQVKIKYTDEERKEIDRYQKDQEEKEKKIKEGINLFCKYFRGLYW